jgi:hypothetical protein
MVAWIVIPPAFYGRLSGREYSIMVSNVTFRNGAASGIAFNPNAAKRVVPQESVNPIGQVPDFIGTGTVKDGKSFDIDARDGRRALSPLKDKDGKRRKNADGSYVFGNERVTLRQAYGEIARTLGKLPGMDTNIGTGTVDYTRGARVNVTWLLNGREMNLTMRVASVVPHASGKAEDVNVRFAVKQTDGTYAEWPIKVGHIRRIQSVD